MRCTLLRDDAERLLEEAAQRADGRADAERCGARPWAFCTDAASGQGERVDQRGRRSSGIAALPLLEERQDHAGLAADVVRRSPLASTTTPKPL